MRCRNQTRNIAGIKEKIAASGGPWGVSKELIATCTVLSGSAHMRDGKELMQNEGEEKAEGISG